MFAEARYNFPICWTNRIRSRDRNPPGDVSPRVATEGARVSVHFRDHTADAAVTNAVCPICKSDAEQMCSRHSSPERLFTSLRPALPV